MRVFAADDPPASDSPATPPSAQTVKPTMTMPEVPADVAAPPADAAKTDSGLASKVIAAGKGKDKPKVSDTVKVHYSGWTTDGKMFDSSVTRGEPTQALIDSIQYTALRLDAVEHARRQFAGATDESQREPLQRLYDACLESFQVIASSLGDQKAVPALPDTGRLVRDLESKGEDLRRSAAGDEDARASTHRFMSVSAHLGLLADAIHDCRNKANALDWEAWNRNYF